MALFMKVNSKKVRNMDKELISGVMKAHIRGTGLTTILMDWENINGLMVEAMKVLGKTINFMEKVTIFGLMAANIKANILMIKSRDLVFISGQMESVMRASGFWGSSTEKAR